MKRAILCGLFATVLIASGGMPAEQAVAPFTREYTAEVIRYVYRWYLDETMLRSVQSFDDCEFWEAPVKTELDEGDRSQFIEMLAPRLKLRVELKKADYRIEELDVHVRNDTFKIMSVELYEKPPADRKAFHVIRFDRKEIVDYLFSTRNDRMFPDEELRERLRTAVREFLGDEAPRETDGPQTVYVAPLSQVSNDLWVFWENGRKIIRFSSDADITSKAYWEFDEIGIEVYDLDTDVVVSMDEVGGSNAYVTRDWASRVLFNCVVLGQKLTGLPPATSPAP